jgi:LytR cell envelope-related transcriptional attenuator
MDSLPFGLSVHHFVSSVGADAGFAALVAVAILVLLYFAHARETATLRTRADEADLRLQDLEARLSDLTEQIAALPAEISVRAASPRVAAAYGGVPAGAVPAAVGADGDRWPPAAPAGVAAPALAAATRLIPHPVRAQPEYEPAATAGRSTNGSSRPVVAASAATVERPVQAAGAGAPRPVAAPPRTGGGSGRPPGAPSGRPPGAGQARPGGPVRPGAPIRPPARRSRGRLLFGALVAGLALAVVVAGVIILTGGSSKKSPSTAGRSSANAALTSRRTSAASAVVPSTVTVSVLNGTDMQGLAGDVAKKLLAHGYRKGAVTNASDQTKTTTLIQYLPHDQRDALAVASALKLSQSAVQPIDSATQRIACSAAPLGCTSAVFVTVGRDLATQ